ncbi:MAG: hypothetical protein RLZZ444_2165, partial [Pseudomonadota bacterium]
MAEKLPKNRPIQRCAIYTRVSSDAGLDQDFNSLDNQREAAEAFIKSQAHEGWSLIGKHYDDGGFSGGSIERPALTELLADVRLGKIDIVVVYKVDRLTRSLADFAKLVELFDAHQVSFVSVTQAFNTTNSMGRLTLNVLLSFAQFEREVTGERIRDKIAASKRKGMWMGGVVPYGYRVEARKLIVNDVEAAAVRGIFERYLLLKSAPVLAAALKQEGFRTRLRTLSDGSTKGGQELTRGPLTAMLRYRIYLGEITHKGQAYPGEHEPIVDLAVFALVQQTLDDNRNSPSRSHRDSGSLLKGKIYDHRGRPMTPTYASKGNARYRYYVSTPNNGDKGDKGDILRLPAYDAERLVVAELQRCCRQDLQGGRFTSPTSAPFADRTEPGYSDDSTLVRKHLERVAFGTSCAELMIIPGNNEEPQTVQVPWTRKRWNKREIVSSKPPKSTQKPIRAEARARLLYAIARARGWLRGFVDGTWASPEEIAAMEGCSERSVRMTLPLAFLSPTIMRAIVE